MQKPMPERFDSKLFSEQGRAMPASSSLSPGFPNNLREIARTLEAHGGGAMSYRLAFDLVLNEIVEYAQKESHATGAAIALIDNGEMVCRATTGVNSPDLGVRVETASGLANACLSTGQMQHCADAETDPRVNTEICRELGVRSMLMAPLVDESEVLGILEIFSDQPYAFSESDSRMLQAVAQRVVEDRSFVEHHARARISDEPHADQQAAQRAAQQESAVSSPIARSGAAEVAPATIQPLSSEFVIEKAEDNPAHEPITNRWTSILWVLVIATAVALVIAIGWRVTARGSRNATHAAAANANANRSQNATQESTPANSPQSAVASPDPASPPSVKTSRGAPQPSSGGLVVTQNGKVIYRMPPSAQTEAAPASSRLIHRVEPEYPEEAKTRNIQGSVVLDIQVLGDGSVGKIDVLQGNATLAEAAVRAVRQWKYQPYLVDGRPVESQTRITFNFALPAS
jgi:TonB family protein